MKRTAFNIKFLSISSVVLITVTVFLWFYQGDIESVVVEKIHITNNHPLIFFLATVTIFLFLILVATHFDSKKLSQTNKKLQILNQSFLQAEKLASLAHWNYNCKTREFYFTENLKILLGIQLHDFKPSIKSFMRLIHHDDQREVWTAFKDTIRYSKPFNIIHRIISQDGHVKYIKTVGELILDSQRNRYLICISMDITEMTLKNRILESKNRKLEIFNSDLASFNYVASHDLQAPLRKIQMFISRINESDANNLTPNAREYISRIHAAAGYMQLMINDLLMFSRTNAASKKFEKTDLNEVLNNVINELNEIIECKRVKFRYDTLPIIEGIPYQLHQLFFHLISNSIKFSNPEIIPEINIVSQEIGRKDEITDTVTKVIKIDIIDNGIGFDKQYSEKIFNLLFRLHDRDKYQGNGLGLAICKKVMENHNGSIEAFSNEAGSIFSLYFPLNCQDQLSKQS
jgi:hypothetical protein